MYQKFHGPLHRITSPRRDIYFPGDVGAGTDPGSTCSPTFRQIVLYIGDSVMRFHINNAPQSEKPLFDRPPPKDGVLNSSVCPFFIILRQFPLWQWFNEWPHTKTQLTKQTVPEVPGFEPRSWQNFSTFLIDQNKKTASATKITKSSFGKYDITKA